MKKKSQYQKRYRKERKKHARGTWDERRTRIEEVIKTTGRKKRHSELLPCTSHREEIQRAPFPNRVAHLHKPTSCRTMSFDRHRRQNLCRRDTDHVQKAPCRGHDSLSRVSLDSFRVKSLQYRVKDLGCLIHDGKVFSISSVSCHSRAQEERHTRQSAPPKTSTHTAQPHHHLQLAACSPKLGQPPARLQSWNY